MGLIYKSIAEILEMDEEEVYKKLTKNVSVEKIKQWVSREDALELRKLGLRGLTIVDDSKRYYPYGNFASYIFLNNYCLVYYLASCTYVIFFYFVAIVLCVSF